MRAVFAAAALVVIAVVLFGDASMQMFAPAPVAEQYGQVQYGQPVAYAQPQVQYGQPVAYAQPQVQLVAASEGRWGFSDLALLAVAGVIVGAVIGSQATRSRNTTRDEEVEMSMEDADEEAALAAVAALAVGGAETTADLESLAKSLNPAVGFFDPLNLAEGEFWDQSNEATIGFLRHAEIKHGRVAMAGFVGYIVHANGIHFPWKIPGDELCAKGVSPTALWDGIPYEAKLQIILTLGIFEIYSEVAVSKSPGQGGHYMRGGKPGYFPPFNLPKGVKGQSGIGTL
jgi:Na+-transporting methylmalonyl-CoA/oxaloacetate decarboxylase gamma subunit